MKQPRQSTILKTATRNLHLVMAESSITAGLLALSIMTPFFKSIGLSQTEISETQMAYTVIVMLLNFPLGYLADRISRKWANILGDFSHVLVLLAYSQVGGFWGAVICECFYGVSSALTDGVDQSLLKHFSDRIAEETKVSKTELLRVKTARLAVMREICNLTLLALGGPIGAISFRLAIALSAVSHFIGGVISIFITDDSEKMQPTHKNPVKDLVRVARDVVKNPMLRRRVAAYAVAREMTHGIIWVATPLFIAAGIPLSVVSFAWVGNALMAMIGAYFAGKYGKELSDANVMFFAVFLMVASMLPMGIYLDLSTVCLYGLMGVIQGWTSATMLPIIQRYTKPSEQTSVISLAKVLAELLYIPTVWIIGFAADIKLNYALFAVVIIFLPLGLISIRSLSKTT